MNKQELKDSKYLSYILRHRPEDLNLKMDEYGYVSVQDLVNNSNFTEDYLRQLVEKETRYAFNEDFSKIRALHGHSVKVIYQNEVIPPDILYHGTSVANYEKILESSMIKSMSRTLVHLSDTKEKAEVIGTRHGEAIVLEIDSKKMYSDGIKFFKSEDGVYLVEDFSTEYIKKD